MTNIRRILKLSRRIEAGSDGDLLSQGGDIEDLKEKNLLGNPTNQHFISGSEFQLPTYFDPFSDAQAKDTAAEDYVHVRVQQRNGKKTLTTVQGMSTDYNYPKVLKDFKKEFCCNGNVVEDKELGKIIQLQGDHRKNVASFLARAGIVKKDLIKVHGF